MPQLRFRLFPFGDVGRRHGLGRASRECHEARADFHIEDLSVFFVMFLALRGLPSPLGPCAIQSATLCFRFSIGPLLDPALQVLVSSRAPRHSNATNRADARGLLNPYRDNRQIERRSLGLDRCSELLAVDPTCVVRGSSATGQILEG
jgi:hypothetical protein